MNRIFKIISFGIIFLTILKTSIPLRIQYKIPKISLPRVIPIPIFRNPHYSYGTPYSPHIPFGYGHIYPSFPVPGSASSSKNEDLNSAVVINDDIYSRNHLKLNNSEKPETRINWWVWGPIGIFAAGTLITIFVLIFIIKREERMKINFNENSEEPITTNDLICSPPLEHPEFHLSISIQQDQNESSSDLPSYDECIAFSMYGQISSAMTPLIVSSSHNQQPFRISEIDPHNSEVTGDQHWNKKISGPQ